MSRRRLLVSFLGVAAPVGLFAGAWTVDRMFHHPPSSLPDPLPVEVANEVPAVAARGEPPRDIFEEIAATCGGPEGVESCAPAAFADMFEDKLFDPPRYKFPPPRSRDELEELWLAMLAGGDHVAAYGLAWLSSKAALPELRRRLLTDRNFYGWETSTPDPNDSVYADNQYHHHQAYITAIEAISGRPLRHAVKLTRAERARLRRDAAGCDEWRAAVWLLHKLDGTPLPGTARNRSKRIRCEGPWLPGDPGYEDRD